MTAVDLQVEKEWGGFDDSDSDAGASIAQAGEQRRRQLAEREEALVPWLWMGRSLRSK